MRHFRSAAAAHFQFSLNSCHCVTSVTHATIIIWRRLLLSADVLLKIWIAKLPRNSIEGNTACLGGGSENKSWRSGENQTKTSWHVRHVPVILCTSAVADRSPPHPDTSLIASSYGLPEPCINPSFWVANLQPASKSKQTKPIGCFDACLSLYFAHTDEQCVNPCISHVKDTSRYNL